MIFAYVVIGIGALLIAALLFLVARFWHQRTGENVWLLLLVLGLFAGAILGLMLLGVRERSPTSVCHWKYTRWERIITIKGADTTAELHPIDSVLDCGTRT